jgi:hypothetical protein
MQHDLVQQDPVQQHLVQQQQHLVQQQQQMMIMIMQQCIQ